MTPEAALETAARIVGQLNQSAAEPCSMSERAVTTLSMAKFLLDYADDGDVIDVSTGLIPLNSDGDDDDLLDVDYPHTIDPRHVSLTFLPGRMEATGAPVVTAFLRVGTAVVSLPMFPHAGRKRAAELLDACDRADGTTPLQFSGGVD